MYTFLFHIGRVSIYSIKNHQYTDETCNNATCKKWAEQKKIIVALIAIAAVCCISVHSKTAMNCQLDGLQKQLVSP